MGKNLKNIMQQAAITTGTTGANTPSNSQANQNKNPNSTNNADNNYFNKKNSILPNYSSTFVCTGQSNHFTNNIFNNQANLINHAQQPLFFPFSNITSPTNQTQNQSKLILLINFSQKQQ